MQSNNIVSIIRTVLIAGAIVVSAGMTYSTADQHLRNQAVESCFRAGTVDSVRGGEGETKELQITEPVREIYMYCLQDKGYTSVIQK